MNMANASELLREEEEYLESKAQEQYKKLLKDSGDGFVSLNADGLASEHGVISCLLYTSILPVQERKGL